MPRVCVLIRRVPRREGVRMSSEPATVTASPAGEAFGCTVQARPNTMQKRARHGSRRRDTRPAISDLPFPRRPRTAPRRVGCSAPSSHVGSPPGACARGRARPARPAFRQEARPFGRPQLSRRNSHSGAVLRATPCRYLSRPSQAWRLLGGSVPPHLDAAALRAWSQPGLIKAGMEFRLEPVPAGTSLSTDTAFSRQTRRRGGPSPRTGLSSGRAVARFAAKY